MRLVTMEDIDRRTRAAQQAVLTKSAIVADLGGEENLSTLERLAAEHAALAAAVTQDAYARWLRGEEVSLPEVATINNCFLRIAGSLGFSRRAKDITSDINTYLRETNHHDGKPEEPIRPKTASQDDDGGC
jgi:hypothetical protein